MVNEVESKIEEVVSSNLLEVNLGQKEARTKQIKDLVPLVFFSFALTVPILAVRVFSLLLSLFDYVPAKNVAGLYLEHLDNSWWLLWL